MVQIEKTHIESIDREIYDVKNKFEYDYKTEAGLTPEIIREISAQKNEPEYYNYYRDEKNSNTINDNSIFSFM